MKMSRCLLIALFLVNLLGQGFAEDHGEDSDGVESNSTKGSSTVKPPASNSTEEKTPEGNSTGAPSSSKAPASNTTAVTTTAAATTTATTTTVKYEEVQKEVTKVTGTMSLKVADPAKAAEDPEFKAAVGAGIASTVGVPEDYVEVEFTVTSRRLQGARRLAGLSVSYTITIPKDAPATVSSPTSVTDALKKGDAAASLTTSITASIKKSMPDSSFTVEVADVAAPETKEETITVKVPVTTEAPTTTANVTSTSAEGTSGATKGAVFQVTATVMLASMLW